MDDKTCTASTGPMTRSEAIAAGLRRFNTGKPCANGHTADRDTLSGACLDCVRANTRAARARVKAALDAKKS